MRSIAEPKTLDAVLILLQGPALSPPPNQPHLGLGRKVRGITRGPLLRPTMADLDSRVAFTVVRPLHAVIMLVLDGARGSFGDQGRRAAGLPDRL